MTCLVVDALLWLAGILVVWLLVALLRRVSTGRHIEGEEEAFILSGGAASEMARAIRAKKEEERRRQAQTSTEDMADMKGRG